MWHMHVITDYFHQSFHKLEFKFSVHIQTKLKMFFFFFCLFIQFFRQCFSDPVEFCVTVYVCVCVCVFTYLTARFLCMIHVNWARVSWGPSREVSGFLTSPTWWMSPVRSRVAIITLFCHHVTRGNAVISQVCENIQVSSQWMCL